MLRIAYDPIYAHPLPEGHRFPMMKYELIPEQLIYEGTIDGYQLFSPGLVDEKYILLAHTEEYWNRLRDQKLSPQEIRRIGFPLTKELVIRELMIAQGTIECAKYSFSNGVAINVAGGTHHAGSNWGEGFCLLNDFAVAACYLLHEKIAKKILIIDLDVHQGNGTAEIFQNDDRVFTFSIHAANNFPYRKEQSDLDIALPDRINDEEYLSLLTREIPALIDKVKPDFIFYLSGVDILSTDKLGKLSVTIQGCKKRDEIILSLCKKLQVPVAVSMGGGYSHDINDIVEAHCNTYRVANEIFF
jgi:acetoin utilization deacetylase AcuC-like enzyme